MKVKSIDFVARGKAEFREIEMKQKCENYYCKV